MPLPSITLAHNDNRSCSPEFKAEGFNVHRSIPSRTEFQSRELEESVNQRGGRFDFIRPDKSSRNAFIEPLNGVSPEQVFERLSLCLAYRHTSHPRHVADGLQSPLTQLLGHLTSSKFGSQRQLSSHSTFEMSPFLEKT